MPSIAAAILYYIAFCIIILGASSDSVSRSCVVCVCTAEQMANFPTESCSLLYCHDTYDDCYINFPTESYCHDTYDDCYIGTIE